MPTTRKPVAFEPLLVRIDDAAIMLAKTRSEIYDEVKRGKLDARRDGPRRTVITMESIRRRAAEMPKADIKPIPGGENGPKASAAARTARAARAADAGEATSATP